MSGKIFEVHFEVCIISHSAYIQSIFSTDFAVNLVKEPNRETPRLRLCFPISFNISWKYITEKKTDLWHLGEVNLDDSCSLKNWRNFWLWLPHQMTERKWRSLKLLKWQCPVQIYLGEKTKKRQLDLWIKSKLEDQQNQQRLEPLRGQMQHRWIQNCLINT